MTKKPKASIKTCSISYPIHVIRAVIAIHELRNWRIEIASEENHQHVIDKVVYIDKIFKSWIGSAIHIKALHLVIISIAGKAVGGSHPQAGPGLHVAVRSENGLACGGINFDDIIILFVAPEISLAI